MQQTLEVRWFYDGSPPQSVIDWFMALAPKQESTREDLYFIADDPSLNVKLRKGKIQLKRRGSDPTPIAFADGVHGYCAPWQKWSFPLADDASISFSEAPSRLWQPVTKARYQRVYRPSEQRALLASLDEPDPATALVELTRVRSGSHEAWTICMETEGRAAALPGTLRQMGRYVFRQGQPPTLDRSHSYGYVRWLRHVHVQTVPPDNAQK